MRKAFQPSPWFYPQPVLIVGTYDAEGKPDAMNAAWGGLYEADMVELCLSHGHKTTQNILAKKAFTVSFATAETVVPCDYVGLVSANNTPDKMERSGFTIEKSDLVDAPVFAQLPLCMECELVRVTEEGNVIGKIVGISADESILDDQDKIDMGKFHPICFEPVHRGYHVMGERVGNAFQDGMKLK